MEQTRKLAAILVADVAGYSRLMGDDELTTIATLDEYRGVFRTRIQAHQGRIVDMAGDSVLAVFETATGAVQAALDVQKEIGEHNSPLPEARRMRFRIGINLGEVINKEDGTVYGDGVNVAARLERLCVVGGVTISGTVFDQVRNRLQVEFDSIGEQTVKNIAEPVRAYHVVVGREPRIAIRVDPRPYSSQAGRQPVAGEAAAALNDARKSASPKLAWSPLTVTVLLLVVLSSAFALWMFLHSQPDRIPSSTRRATIPLPGPSGTRTDVPWFALGDDGLLVYAVQGTTDPMLSRRLDASGPRPIDGTSSGAAPFLSPDGRMLGFQRGVEMFVVPMSGGAITRVKDAVFLANGRPAWTTDGRIVYTGGSGALFMVRPDGTSSEQLTTPNEATRDVSPAMLPDGRTVLFAEIGGDVNDARIVAFTFADRRTRTLVTGGAMTPQYADGFLFYCRPDGTLMAAPFDATRVELTGEARALPERVDRSRFGVAHYAAAPGLVVYAPRAQTRLVEMDRENAVTVLTEEGRWHMPRYSPDGTRILFDRVATDGGDRDVWTLSRADKTLSRVTRIGDAHDPTWLPNGREVSFLSFKLPGGPLIIAAADGSGEAHPVPVAGPFPARTLVNPGAWLPDGSAYLAGIVEASGNSDIWRIPREGGIPVKLVGQPFDEYSPSVSADGRWLAYQSNETGRAEVYVRPLANVQGRLQVSSAGATAPVWDKRLMALYYLETDGTRLHLVEASLRTTPALAVTHRRVVLPDVRLEQAANHPNYDVDPSGARFLMPEQTPLVGVGVIFDVAASLHGTQIDSK